MKRLKKFIVLSHEWNIFLALLIIISITVFSWFTVKIHLEKEWNARLASEAEKIISVLTRELYGYGHALFDAKAHIQTTGVPNSKQFEAYVEASQLLKRFPGLMGISYAQVFTKPAGERYFSTPIVRIQSEDLRAHKWLGFDMYADPLSQKVMDKALITQSLAISDPLVLVPEKNSPSRRGLYVTLPIFRSEKSNSLQGFLFSIVQIERFFNGALGVPAFHDEKVNYKISTQNSATGATKTVYERFSSKEMPPLFSPVSLNKEITVFDQTWSLHFEPLPHFYNWYERYIPILLALFTLTLLSLIFLALWYTRQFLRISEKNKNFLAQVSKNKTSEIVLFRRLNTAVADLSASIESQSLFERFCFHIKELFQIDDCVVYIKEGKGPYKKKFQKESEIFPEDLSVAEGFENSDSLGVVSAASEEGEAQKVLQGLPAGVRQILVAREYHLMRTLLHESGKATSILVFLKGPGGLCETKMAEYALLRIFEQFSSSYDKAILLRRAEDANLMKSFFLANMSHEIRTPLGIIMGYSEMLAQEGLSLDQKTEIIKNLKRNGKDLARLIDDILDISKVESGKLYFELTQVPLENMIEEIKSIMGARASEKHIHFQVVKAVDVPSSIITDDIRLKQILINIVGNAIKFTEKGHVKLVLSLFQNENKEESIDFQVHDTGIGISELSQESLFRPFSQGDVTSTRKYGGTGLGLALSKRLAELLGGDLFLKDSVVGRGSTFCLRIPLKAASAPLRIVESLPEETAARPEINWNDVEMGKLLHGNRILLVEDSEDNQDIFLHFLGSAGAEVILAEDGEKAVDLALTCQPHLILMDIQIPKMDGKEATRRIRQKGFQGPIVALTAHALPEERKTCFAAGCNGQITKPVAGRLLIQEVHFYLNQRSEKNVGL